MSLTMPQCRVWVSEVGVWCQGGRSLSGQFLSHMSLDPTSSHPVITVLGPAELVSIRMISPEKSLRGACRLNKGQGHGGCLLCDIQLRQKLSTAFRYLPNGQ